MTPSLPQFFKHQPGGLLGRYVRSVWYHPAGATAGDSGVLTLAAGHAGLVISLEGRPQSIWTDAQQRGRPQAWRQATVRLPPGGPVASALVGGGAALGISFAPGGLRQFTPLALCDIGSGVAPLQDLIGAQADGFVECLAAPSSAATRFALARPCAAG